MLRFLSRLHVQKRLSTVNRPQVQYYCDQNQPKKDWIDNDDQRPTLLTYYINSNRHEVFQKLSSNLYQFDDETRNITLWEYPKPKRNCSWDQPTFDYNNNELIDAFQSLLSFSDANDIPLSDSRFDQFIDAFAERLQSFTLNETMRALQMFARIPVRKFHPKQKNYIELMRAFDQASTIKSQDLLPLQLLFISSIWLTIPFARRTYISQLISRLLNRYMKTMTGPQMAQSLLFINVLHQEITSIRALENIFEQKINDLTIEEFTTVLWTFIRLETKLEKQELRKEFFKYLEQQDLSELPESMLTKILTIVTRIYTPTIANSNEWKNISKNLKANLNKRSLKLIILMANVGVPVRLFDDELIWNIFERCRNQPDEMKALSMADLECLTRILTMSQYEDKDTIQQVAHLILDEIIDRLEFVASRGIFTNFINIVRNLTFLDIYDLELMDNIFRPDYIKFMYKSSKQIDMQMYEINGYNCINLKGIYKGNTLPDNYLSRICYMINFVPDRTKYKKHDEFSYDIEDVVRKLFTHCKWAHAVAHRRHADLITCIDRTTLKPIDITNNFPQFYQGKNIEANSLTNNNPNAIVLAFVPGNKKEYLTDKRNECEIIPIDHLAQKIKQLKLLGFHPIVIPIHPWKNKSPDMPIEQVIINGINKELRASDIEGEVKLTDSKS